VTTRGIILSAGVFKSFGGAPALMSHSEAMGVAGRTFVLRGSWVLIRRFSAPMSSLTLAEAASVVLAIGACRCICVINNAHVIIRWVRESNP